MKDSGQRVFLMCGGIFLLVGVVFTGVTVWMFSDLEFLYANGTGNVELMPYIFGALGLLMVILGAALLLHAYKVSKAQKALLEKGESITAVISGVSADYQVRINRAPTYKVECDYHDPRTNVLHKFYSKNLRYHPGSAIIGKNVRVYVDNKSDYEYINYYVDIDPLLPEIKIH